jgi:hypothetical protein
MVDRTSYCAFTKVLRIMADGCAAILALWHSPEMTQMFIISIYYCLVHVPQHGPCSPYTIAWSLFPIGTLVLDVVWMKTLAMFMLTALKPLAFYIWNLNFANSYLFLILPFMLPFVRAQNYRFTSKHCVHFKGQNICEVCVSFWLKL